MTWDSTLKDKNGNPPSIDDINFIKQMKRELFFPCTCSYRDLAMPIKETAPKRMNKFIVFRRLLAIIADRENLSYDGKTISRIAAYMWNGADDSEKQGYAQIAQELRQIHKETYPNYIEKRRSKLPYYNNFISCNEIYKQNCDIPLAPQVSAETGPVNVVPVPTLQVQPNGVMCSMYSTYNHSPYAQTVYADPLYPTINDYGINYDTMGFASAMTHQQPSHEVLQQNFLDGDLNAGFYNPPISYVAESLERPVDELILPNFEVAEVAYNYN